MYLLLVYISYLYVSMCCQFTYRTSTYQCIVSLNIVPLLIIVLLVYISYLYLAMCCQFKYRTSTYQCVVSLHIVPLLINVMLVYISYLYLSMCCQFTYRTSTYQCVVNLHIVPLLINLLICNLDVVRCVYDLIVIYFKIFIVLLYTSLFHANLYYLDIKIGPNKLREGSGSRD